LARLQKIEDQEYLESGAVVLKAAVSSFRNQEKDGDDHWRVITRRMKTPELIQRKWRSNTRRTLKFGQMTCFCILKLINSVMTAIPTYFLTVFGPQKWAINNRKVKEKFFVKKGN
jgi:hypothetical protein